MSLFTYRIPSHSPRVKQNGNPIEITNIHQQYSIVNIDMKYPNLFAFLSNLNIAGFYQTFPSGIDCDV